MTQQQQHNNSDIIIIKKNKKDVLSAVSLIKNSVELSAISIYITFKTSIYSNNVAV